MMATVSTDRGLRQRIAAVSDRALRTRWVVRAPILLFRARLGILFGHRMLMLEHTGRKSGRARLVVLEVVSRPRPGSWIVVSGFGTRAQWWRNLAARPQGRVWSGSAAPVPVSARPLGREEALAALHDYAVAHPRAWRTLCPALERTLGTPITADGAELPMLELAASG